MNEKLIGTWKCIDDDCSMRVAVSRNTSGAIQIRAYDLSDEEELEVSNIRISPRTIYFDCMVPSNGYRTRNYLVLQCDGTCKYALTTSEVWVKES